MTKLIFLSHIHEERELALLIKNALEDEFSGFVDVFVSSDGTSIPAGANFLKRIETGLSTCAAALYLISPKSVSRQWINFELGAVWIRNVISRDAGGGEIPAVPVCHSGCRPQTLPAPLNNLNGIVAADSAQLEFAFRSIQTAMGGRGKLKTDFDALAQQIAAIETKLTVGQHLKELFDMIPISLADRETMLADLAGRAEKTVTLMDIPFESAKFKRLKQLEAVELKGKITVEFISAGTYFGNSGVSNISKANVIVSKDALLENKATLLG